MKGSWRTLRSQILALDRLYRSRPPRLVVVLFCASVAFLGQIEGFLVHRPAGLVRLWTSGPGALVEAAVVLVWAFAVLRRRSAGSLEAALLSAGIVLVLAQLDMTNRQMTPAMWRGAALLAGIIVAEPAALSMILGIVLLFVALLLTMVYAVARADERSR